MYRDIENVFLKEKERNNKRFHKIFEEKKKKCKEFFYNYG